MSTHALPEKVRKGDPKRDRGNGHGVAHGMVAEPDGGAEAPGHVRERAQVHLLRRGGVGAGAFEQSQIPAARPANAFD